ncbi:hypothetical protein Droror1_Dr00026903 [Drosera rotundifolia]
MPGSITLDIHSRRLSVSKEEKCYYCSAHGVPYKQLGKLIVVTRESEVPKLNELMIRGTENGVDGLRMIGASEAKEMEPELHGVKVLLSPASGIVDSHSLMLSLLGYCPNLGSG